MLILLILTTSYDIHYNVNTRGVHRCKLESSRFISQATTNIRYSESLYRTGPTVEHGPVPGVMPISQRTPTSRNPAQFTREPLRNYYKVINYLNSFHPQWERYRRIVMLSNGSISLRLRLGVRFNLDRSAGTSTGQTVSGYNYEIERLRRSFRQ